MQYEKFQKLDHKMLRLKQINDNQVVMLKSKDNDIQRKLQKFIKQNKNHHKEQKLNQLRIKHLEKVISIFNILTFQKLAESPKIKQEEIAGMVFIKKYKLEEQAMLIQKYKTQIKDQNH